MISDIPDVTSSHVNAGAHHTSRTPTHPRVWPLFPPINSRHETTATRWQAPDGRNNKLHFPRKTSLASHLSLHPSQYLQKNTELRHNTKSAGATARRSNSTTIWTGELTLTARGSLAKWWAAAADRDEPQSALKGPTAQPACQTPRPERERERERETTRSPFSPPAPSSDPEDWPRPLTKTTRNAGH